METAWIKELTKVHKSDVESLSHNSRPDPSSFGEFRLTSKEQDAIRESVMMRDIPKGNEAIQIGEIFVE